MDVERGVGTCKKTKSKKSKNIGLEPIILDLVDRRRCDATFAVVNASSYCEVGSSMMVVHWVCAEAVEKREKSSSECGFRFIGDTVDVAVRCIRDSCNPSGQ